MQASYPVNVTYCLACLARLRADDGTALVEFALVLPILLVLVMGILWFGRALNYSEDETHLVNVAARYAAVDQVPPSAGSQTLGQWLRSQVDSAELRNGTGSVSGVPQVCVEYPNGTGVGNPVQVSMTANFTWLPLLKVGPGTAIKRLATMRIEVSPTAPFYAAGCS